MDAAEMCIAGLRVQLDGVGVDEAHCASTPLTVLRFWAVIRLKNSAKSQDNSICVLFFFLSDFVKCVCPYFSPIAAAVFSHFLWLVLHLFYSDHFHTTEVAPRF